MYITSGDLMRSTRTNSQLHWQSVAPSGMTTGALIRLLSIEYPLSPLQYMIIMALIAIMQFVVACVTLSFHDDESRRDILEVCGPFVCRTSYNRRPRIYIEHRQGRLSGEENDPRATVRRQKTYALLPIFQYLATAKFVSAKDISRKCCSWVSRGNGHESATQFAARLGRELIQHQG